MHYMLSEDVYYLYLAVSSAIQNRQPDFECISLARVESTGQPAANVCHVALGVVALFRCAAAAASQRGLATIWN
jgi:hypothetical protein